MKNLSILVLLCAFACLTSCGSDNDNDLNYGFETYDVRYELEFSGNYLHYERLAVLGGTNNELDTLTIDNDNLSAASAMGNGYWTYQTNYSTPTEEKEVYDYSDPVTTSAMSLQFTPVDSEHAKEMSVHISTYLNNELDQDSTITFKGFISLNISAPGTIITAE